VWQPIPTDFITHDDIIYIKDGKKDYFVRIRDIGAITSSSEYTEVLTTRFKPILARRSLKEWEEILPPAHFSKIHRQTIVNLDYLEKLEPLSNNRLAVHLRSGFPKLATD